MVEKKGGRRVIPLHQVEDAMKKAGHGDVQVTMSVNAERLAELDQNRAGLRELILPAIVEQVSLLMDEVGEKVMDGFTRAYVAHCEDEPQSDAKWKYKVGLGVTIVPLGGKYAVTAACRYGVTRKHVSAGRVVQLELPAAGAHP